MLGHAVRPRQSFQVLLCSQMCGITQALLAVCDSIFPYTIAAPRIAQLDLSGAQRPGWGSGTQAASPVPELGRDMLY